MGANETPTRRIVELDSLRALAAINLMLFHFTHVFSVKYGYSSPLGFEWPYGKYGVQLFFMLSGFVNAMTLLRKRKTGDFLVGRLVRVCPSYWLVIGTNLLLISLIPLTMSQLSMQDLAANLTIMPNLFGYECMEPVTWTLQVEMLFYGLILLMFVTRSLESPLRTMMTYMALSLVGGLSIEYLATTNMNPTVMSALHLLRSLLRLDFMPLFALGVLIHQIKSQQGNRWANLGGIVVCATVFHVIDRHGHNPAATVLLTGLLAFCAYGKMPLLRLRPLIFISTISYSLYLFHNNLGCVLIYYLDRAGVPPLACFVAGIVFAVAISALITFVFERPVTNALRRVWKALQQYRLIQRAPTERPAGDAVMSTNQEPGPSFNS